jgi:hypothetical protein
MAGEAPAVGWVEYLSGFSGDVCTPPGVRAEAIVADGEGRLLRSCHAPQPFQKGADVWLPAPAANVARDFRQSFLPLRISVLLLTMQMVLQQRAGAIAHMGDLSLA